VPVCNDEQSIDRAESDEMMSPVSKTADDQMQGIRMTKNFVGARLDIALLSVIGYVDTTTCYELTRVIKELIRQKRYQIIADLGGVTYISSAGWGAFVGEIRNIRDLGGDLKLVQMTQEVYEIFEMLEFNKILNTYDSLEEAIDEFDLIRGIDISKVEPKVQQTAIEIPSGQALTSGNVQEVHYVSPPTQLTVSDYPLAEKVKLAVLDNPLAKNKEILRKLRSDQFGKVRIGRFRLRSVLKQLSLDTKEKRYRFYRSR